jgi:hypothetical protein
MSKEWRDKGGAPSILTLADRTAGAALDIGSTEILRWGSPALPGSPLPQDDGTVGVTGCPAK